MNHEDAQSESIAGIGIDLVETERVRRVMERWGATFLDRVFLDSEQEYCRGKAAPWRHYAGRFAVKEAVSKAFGTGIGEHLGWLDMEVIKTADSGAPCVRLLGRGLELARRRGMYRIWISLSHTHTAAVAQAVLVSHPRAGGREGGAA